MKSRFLTLLAVACVFGCSKQPTGGTVASNSTTDKSPTSSAPAGDATGATTPGTPGTPAPGATPTGGTATGTPPTASPAGTGAAPSGTKPGTPPPGGPKSTPGPGGAAIQTTPGTTGAPPQLTPEQRKQQAQAIQSQKENGEKAEKASKSAISGVSGSYVGFIDDAKVPPEMHKRPGFDEALAKAKEDIKKAIVTVAANGDISVQGVPGGPLTGFTSKIDGKPVFVFVVSKPQPGMPAKQFVPMTVLKSGEIIMLGRATFKRS